MAKQTKLYLHARHNSKATSFTSADTTTPKVVFVAGGDDTDWKVGTATSDDTAPVNLMLYLRSSGVNYPIVCKRIATLSGVDGVTSSANLLDTTLIPGLALDQVLKPYLPMKSGDEIWAAPLSTITAAKTVTVICSGHDL